MRDSLNRAWLEIPISCSCFFPAINLHFSRRFPSLICPLQSPEAVYYDAAAANHMEASGFPRFTEKRWNPGDHFFSIDFREILRGTNIHFYRSGND